MKSSQCRRSTTSTSWDTTQRGSNTSACCFVSSFQTQQQPPAAHQLGVVFDGVFRLVRREQPSGADRANGVNGANRANGRVVALLQRHASNAVNRSPRAGVFGAGGLDFPVSPLHDDYVATSRWSFAPMLLARHFAPCRNAAGNPSGLLRAGMCDTGVSS